ncbi:MAG: restriction endonuclease subunit S [Gammaproteobacteria bacterium]
MDHSQRKISDIAEVLPGYALKTRALHEPDGSHQIILAKHLKAGAHYSFEPGHALRISPGTDVEKYIIRQGDVLFVSRGVHNHACAVTSVPANTIASSTLYIIRRNTDISSRYLAWCMNQQMTQTQIARVRTGAATPIIQRVEFSAITIPVPPVLIQRQIVKLDELMQKEMEIQIVLTQQAEKLHNKLGNELMKKLSSGNYH